MGYLRKNPAELHFSGAFWRQDTVFPESTLMCCLSSKISDHLGVVCLGIGKLAVIAHLKCACEHLLRLWMEFWCNFADQIPPSVPVMTKVCRWGPISSFIALRLFWADPGVRFLGNHHYSTTINNLSVSNESLTQNVSLQISLAKVCYRMGVVSFVELCGNLKRFGALRVRTACA